MYLHKKLLTYLAALSYTTTVNALELSHSLSKPGAYVGISHSNVKYKEPAAPSLRIGATGVGMGYRFNQYFAFEGRLLVSSQSDTLPGIKAEFDRYVGANIITNIPMTSNYSFYGSLGYGRSTLRVTQTNFGSREFSDSSISYGAGVQFDIEQLLIRVGYETLYDSDDVSANGFTLSGMAKF